MSRKIIMNVGPSDEMLLRKRALTEDDIYELIGLCAANGCSGINWRTSCPLGRYLYRTKLPNRMVFDREDFMRAGAFEGISPILSERTRQADMWAWLLKATQEMLDRFDPLAVARQAAREHKLEFYIWWDPFDDYFPGHMNDFMVRHPECQWTSRDGQDRFNYLRSYAFPESREHQLAYICELLRYEPTGLYLSTSCHSQHGPRPVKPDYYGFEAPVAERYLERCGTDPRETLQIDEEAWHRIKGEFITEFHRAVKREMRGIGANLWIGCQLGDRLAFRYPYFSGNVVAQCCQDWRAWVREGIADMLMVGDYQDLWNWYGSFDRAQPFLKDVEWPAEAAAEFFAEECAGRCELILFSAWLHQEHFPDGIALRGKTLREHPADGIALQEVMAFEEHNGWDDLRRLAEQSFPDGAK